jgi:hypothetical protein
MSSFNHDTQSWDILIGVLFPLTVLALLLRFLARRKKQTKLALDDILAVIAFIFWIGYAAVFLWCGS